MKFDKSKILTCVTADQAKVGQKGWFAVLPQYIPEIMSGCQEPSVLSNIDLEALSPFTMEGGCSWPLFYPAPEPTYAERQAEWVKENNVRFGTKVRFTKNFTNGEDGSWCCGHNEAKGMEGVVKYTGGDSLTVLVPYFGAWWAVPFTALEVIKEPTYTERQAEWVKENNVKEGTKVRVTRTFTKDEDGSYCCEHDDLVGMIGSVDKYGIVPHSLGIIMSDGYHRAIPYFALEVIKEPTYRPYNNDELNDLVGEILTNKQSGRRRLVTGKPTEGSGVNLDGSYINAKNLLSSFYRNTNEPCGIKE